LFITTCIEKHCTWPLKLRRHYCTGKLKRTAGQNYRTYIMLGVKTAKERWDSNGRAQKKHCLQNEERIQKSADK